MIGGFQRGRLYLSFLMSEGHQLFLNLEVLTLIEGLERGGHAAARMTLSEIIQTSGGWIGDEKR